MLDPEKQFIWGGCITHPLLFTHRYEKRGVGCLCQNLSLHASILIAMTLNAIPWLSLIVEATSHAPGNGYSRGEYGSGYNCTSRIGKSL